MEIILGVDLGNGYIKISTEKGNIIIPSVLGRLEKDELSIGNKLDVFKVGDKFVMGKDVLKLPTIVTNTGEGRYIDENYKTALEGAIAYTLLHFYGSDELYNVKIITGVPSKEKGTVLEEHLKKAIAGIHNVSINNKNITFKAEVLKIHAQPLGTLFYKFLNESNLYPYDEKYIAIVDCGYGTIDIDCIKQLRTVQADRDTFNDVAVYSIYSKIADYINSINPYALATARSVEMQFDNDIYRISDRASVDIVDIKEKIIDETSTLLLNKLQSRWQNITKFDKIILAGGSSKVYKKYLQAKLGDIEVVDSPQIANAIGFYLFGKLYS